MKQFAVTLPQNIVRCFTGRLSLWHLAAIGLTVWLVESGWDWQYFLATRSPVLREWMFPAAPIGGLVPLLLPLLLLVVGYAWRHERTIRTGWAVGQAEFIGSMISSAYKAVTGRAHPVWNVGPDISQVFHFGLLRGGVFWGWPSSHTTIAFAAAAALRTLYPRQRWLAVVSFAYAFYIGLGVSMTIHWLSDFVAGAILGTVIGMVVGRHGFTHEPSGCRTEG